MKKTLLLLVTLMICLASQAAAQCKQWDISGVKEIKQSDGYTVVVDIHQNGNTFSGNAEYVYARQTPGFLGVGKGVEKVTVLGTLTGNVAGDVFYAEVQWRGRGTGIYRGTLTLTSRTEGKLGGGVNDKLKPSVRADWFMMTPVKCAVFNAGPERARSQGEWRQCRHCNGLFFNGFATKGGCVGNGTRGHEPEPLTSTNYFPKFGNLPATSNDQTNWRYCEKCHQMFYDGFPGKGMCPVDIGFASGGVPKGGAGHRAQGYNFRLKHDVIPSLDGYQYGWRWCERCYVVFWDGSPKKGACPGDRHKAQGFNYMLPIKSSVSQNSGSPSIFDLTTAGFDGDDACDFDLHGGD